MLWKRYFAGCAVAALTLALAACGQTASPPDEFAVEASSEEETSEWQSDDGEPRDFTVAPPVQPFCQEIGRRVSPADCDVLNQLADGAQAGAAAFNTPDPMKRGERHTLQLAIGHAPTPEEIAERERLEQVAAMERQQAATTERAARRAEYVRRYGPATTDAILAGRVEVGMTQEQVRASRGSPSRLETLTSTNAVWHYGAERVVFSDGRVTFVEATQREVGESSTLPQPEPPPTPAETVDPLQGETVEFQPLVGRFMRAELKGAGFNIAPLSPPSQEVLPDSVTTWTWEVIAEQGGQRALTLTTVVEGCTAEGQCYPLRSTSRNYAVNVTVGWLGWVEDFLTAAPNWLKLVAGALAALAVLVAAGFGLRNALRGGRERGGA